MKNKKRQSSVLVNNINAFSSQTEAGSCQHNDFAWLLGSSFPTACFVPAKGV